MAPEGQPAGAARLVDGGVDLVEERHARVEEGTEREADKGGDGLGGEDRQRAKQRGLRQVPQHVSVAVARAEHEERAHGGEQQREQHNRGWLAEQPVESLRREYARLLRRVDHHQDDAAHHEQTARHVADAERFAEHERRDEGVCYDADAADGGDDRGRRVGVAVRCEVADLSADGEEDPEPPDGEGLGGWAFVLLLAGAPRGGGIDGDIGALCCAAVTRGRSGSLDVVGWPKALSEGIDAVVSDFLKAEPDGNDDVRDERGDEAPHEPAALAKVSQILRVAGAARF
mmetsp:Transcript_51509/g.168420  ORF Transcript_51509/g.168420 Transcript_51509/m.168420 type:complete len:287 (-) Transcript_51509:164-1024(-)